MQGLLQLREVVEMDDTGKIISIPEIDLNMDASKGRRPDDSKLEGTSGGAYPGDVAPWTKPPSPLTLLPTKRSSGITGLGKVPFFSLKSDARELKDSNHSHSHDPEYSRADLRATKSSLRLNNNSKLSLPGSSSPAASSSGARMAKARLAMLLRFTGKKRSKSKIQENNGEHPSLRPRTPPLPEVPGTGAYSITPDTSPVMLSQNGRKKRKDKDKDKDRDRDKERDRDAAVAMKLDLDLDQMEGIVDTDVFTSSLPANGTLVGKGSSITQSLSDDIHSLHSHPSYSPSSHQYSGHLGPVQASEFHNPFSSFASSPTQGSSLAKLTDRRISPRTIISGENRDSKDLNVVTTSSPMLKHGLHGGQNGTGAMNNAQPPHSPSWFPPQSWNVQHADFGDPEAEEGYYSSSEDSLEHGGSGNGGSRSIGYGPQGRRTVGGGRPMRFARPNYSDLDDDESAGLDKLGRQLPHYLRSVASFRSTSTSTSNRSGSASYSSPYFPASTSATGSTSSVNSNLILGTGNRRKDLLIKKPKFIGPRRNSKPNNAAGPSSSSNDPPTIHSDYTGPESAPITNRMEFRLDILDHQRPSYSPSHLIQDLGSQSQQHLSISFPLKSSLPFLGSRAHPGPPHSTLPPEIGSRRQQDSSRFSIRIYRANNTYHVVQCGFNVTVAKLIPKLKEKLLLGEEREMHMLYLRERGTERILGQMERPADIVRRRLEQAGYDLNDGLGLLGGDGLGLLLKFMFKSQVFAPTEQALAIGDYEHVDLSDSSLRTIPVALHQHADQIFSLSLSRNPMLDLPLDFIQSSTSLTELRLSQMALKKVPTNIRFAVSLARLDLSSNCIGDLDDAYLAEIPGLRSLKVQNNRLEKLPWYFPKLRSLTTLNISSNKFRILPTVVCQLGNLRDLDISFNNIAGLPGVLGKLRNLEHFIMVGNQIRSIPPNASSLVSLKHLDCRRNRIGDFTVIGMLPKLEKLFADHNTLHGIDLRLGPCLMTMNASYNKITEMRVVPGNSYTALLFLDVSHSELSSIAPLALSSLPSLCQLNLSHNNIKTLPSTLGNLVHLTILSIADNVLERLPEGIGKLQRLEVLDVRRNNLTELPGELWTCASLVKLNATSNSIEKWCLPTALLPPPPTDNRDSSSLMRTSPGLHMHPFQGQRKGSATSIINPVKPSSSYLPSLAYTLEKLYLGENHLTAEALGFLSLFQKLKVLNLSFNLIQDLPPTFFKSFFSSIDTTSYSSSSLSSAGAQNQMPRSSLEELYLSGNKLTTLPTEDIARMTQLKTLYLNGNRLQTLPQELGKVVNLTMLDVGSNLLKYNIYNWEFDWNWNFNKNLKYLNLSGNKRFQIKSDMTKLPGTSAAVIHPQLLGGFTDLTELRVLGLMDVTVITTGQILGEHKARHVRTSESTICGMAYGIADTLGQDDCLHVLDLVHEFPHGNKAIFAIFSQSQLPKTVPMGISGNKIAKFLRDNYIEVFQTQLSALRKDEAEGITDALRRSFLKLNQSLFDMLTSNWKQMQEALSNRAMARSGMDIHNPFISMGGASGIVLYFQDKTLYVANAGNALAVISRAGNAEPISRKHDTHDLLEVSRIRAARGWVSPAGLVKNEIDISRSFGFFHLFPVINARPDIIAWQISELDEFVIIGNQGLWDFVSYETAVDIVGRERGDPMLAAQKLRDFVMSYGADGSTMIMVISISDLFKENRKRSGEGSVMDSQIWKYDDPVPPSQVSSQLWNAQHSKSFKQNPSIHSNLISLSDGDSPVFLILQQVLCNKRPGPMMKDLTWMRDLLASHDQSVLQELADFIQLELDLKSSFDFLNSGRELSREVLDRRCLRTLRYLSNNYHILPSSLTVTDIRQESYHPVAGGGFADIWRGSMGDQPVCLKVLRLVVETDEEVRKNLRRRFYNEALIWRQLKHPNILPLLGVNADLFTPSFCLISPWMENKNIITFLKQNPLHSRQTVFLEIAAGLSYLHSKKITHGDFRGANILVTDDLHCCLADFGLALTTSDSQAWSVATTGSMKGAVRWMAPELLNPEDITDETLKSPSRDIFALGCTMVEILTLQLPFRDQKTDYAVLAYVVSGKRPVRPENVWCPDAVWNIITSCWAQESVDRPNSQEVHKALSQVQTE